MVMLHVFGTGPLFTPVDGNRIAMLFAGSEIDKLQLGREVQTPS
jgi:hypothetical protein